MVKGESTERVLALLLRVAGFTLISAFGAIFLPSSWMAATHRWLGLGEFPDSPLVEYLTRSVSALYGMRGVLYLVLATDVRRYAVVILYVALTGLAFAVIMIFVDLYSGLPLFWVLAEGPSIAIVSTVFLVLTRRLTGARS